MSLRGGNVAVVCEQADLVADRGRADPGDPDPRRHPVGKGQRAEKLAPGFHDQTHGFTGAEVEHPLINQKSVNSSSHGKSIPPFHYMIALAGGEDIKCAEYATFGTKELSQNVIKALENRSACLMSNHGQVAFGKNLDQAFELAQEIENICHQYTIALKLGEPKILSLEEMKKVLEKAKDYKKG